MRVHTRGMARDWLAAMTLLVAVGCSPAPDYADLDRSKTVESLAGPERAALCQETERVFSRLATVDSICFQKDPLDRSGTADQARSRCESQQKACREHPPIPVDCTLREHCTVTVEQYDGCLEELAARYQDAKEISCPAYATQQPPTRPGPNPYSQPCLNDPFDDPCAALIQRCPGLYKPWNNWGRCP
jgi:hypothetical protein